MSNAYVQQYFEIWVYNISLFLWLQDSYTALANLRAVLYLSFICMEIYRCIN